jgi:hypothetical protein
MYLIYRIIPNSGVYAGGGGGGTLVEQVEQVELVVVDSGQYYFIWNCRNS